MRLASWHVEKGGQNMTRLLIPLVAEPAPFLVEPELNGLRVASPLAAWTTAVAAAADECLIVDPQGHVVACSAAAARLLDVSEASLIGRELADVVQFVGFGARPVATPDTTHRLAPLVALRSGATSRGLARVHHRAGRLATCDIVAVPLHDAERTLLGLLVHLAEVTGR
jgi:PAS domain-containing protein